ASGSGHILVEAYNVFKEIYLERGYRTKDIPRLILEKNLYGLDIDDRAAQLACFAVLMKARRDDRRILSCDDLKLHVMAIQETSSFDTEALTKNLLKEKVIRFTGENELFPDFKGQMALRTIKRPEVSRDDVIELLELFQHGKTFGSLITIPDELDEKLPLFTRLIEDKLQNGDMFERTAASKFKPVVEMAIILARKYDCVVTNPPYMGSKGMNPKLKAFAKEHFPVTKSDLFAMFIERGFDMVIERGYNSMVTMQSWMFLSSYEILRERLLKEFTITCMVHMANMVMRIAFGTAATVWRNLKQPEFRGNFSYVYYEDLTEDDKPKQFPMQNDRLATASAADFKKIPGSPIAYWISEKIVRIFDNEKKLESIAHVKVGLQTGSNEIFVREWFEVSDNKTSFNSNSAHNYSRKWFPYNKGGEYRKWYGNNENIVNWENNGYEIQNFTDNNGKLRSRPQNRDYYFKKSITWSFVSSSYFGVRYSDSEAIFDVGGSSAFPSDADKYYLTGLLCSKLSHIFMKAMNPTLNFQAGNVSAIPVIKNSKLNNQNSIIEQLIQTHKDDWNSFETSWDFTNFPLLQPDNHQSTLKATYTSLLSHWRNMTLEMQCLEEENNRIFIEAYGLQDELTPEVPLSEITLTCNPHYRYGGNKSEEELEALLLDDTMKELIFYSIGCMMGRYRLDHPGIIYANSGNENFWEIYNQKTNKQSDNPSLRSSLCGEFQPDDDGIIPIMDQNWFPDDATNRFVEFLKVAWPPEHIDENLKFVADSLKPKNNEAPVDTIRRYLSAGFFKDHLKTYKKRPIYWLFSSGRQKAFECLVYLHRYNESTLPRIRSNYVTPLQGKFNARLDYLRTEKDAADKVSAKKKIQKEIDVLKKKQAELSAFDIELRHYADMKISLDLDDGVKVNYGKFGNLLAEEKAVTGKK
ncbi:MAG: BREX-1 system adenine-specific DNA-methyltransferase PglX, partial [Deltaproteobacteria bacterium]|nr:BREX-1 system adenine-specific DNA-methyltransferase PglX [Deltaproteobacteria bacterium]